eukprot:391284-Alexandrium_andersonii.AAC.1
MRFDAGTHRLAPPRPRDRREFLESPSRPSLFEGAARHGPHLARLAGTHGDDARGRTPTTPRPDSGLPPG